MKLEIAVPINGVLVHYEVFPDIEGIYHARLLSHNGDSRLKLPQTLTLTRSVRRWVGSYDRPELVERIGREIDQKLNGERNRSTTSDPASGM